jgi:predicted O-methyltransferase YrrM
MEQKFEYFDLESGKEHYKLIQLYRCVSKEYPTIDIGTYFGFSAIAAHFDKVINT